MKQKTTRGGHQLSPESTAEELLTSTGINVSTESVQEMGFSLMEWCKAHHYWTVEQWNHVLSSDESCFFVRESDGPGEVMALEDVAFLTVLLHH